MSQKNRKMGENVENIWNMAKWTQPSCFPPQKTYITRDLAIQRCINKEKMDEILFFLYKKPQIYIYAGS